MGQRYDTLHQYETETRIGKAHCQWHEIDVANDQEIRTELGCRSMAILTYDDGRDHRIVC
jgi:hypothetical protein